MMDEAEIARWLESYQDEVNSAHLYRYISSVEKSEPLKVVYQRMAESEMRHIAVWEKRLREAGKTDLPTSPDLRTRILVVIARVFGPQAILSILMGGERKATRSYSVKRGRSRDRYGSRGEVP